MKNLLIAAFLLTAATATEAAGAPASGRCDVCWAIPPERHHNRMAFLSDNCTEDGDSVKIHLEPASANLKNISSMDLAAVYNTDHAVSIHFADHNLITFYLEAVNTGHGRLNTAHVYFPSGLACADRVKSLVHAQTWWMDSPGDKTFPIMLCAEDSKDACKARLGCGSLAGAVGWKTMLGHCRGKAGQD